MAPTMNPLQMPAQDGFPEGVFFFASKCMIRVIAGADLATVAARKLFCSQFTGADKLSA